MFCLQASESQVILLQTGNNIEQYLIIMNDKWVWC